MERFTLRLFAGIAGTVFNVVASIILMDTLWVLLTLLLLSIALTLLFLTVLSMHSSYIERSFRTRQNLNDLDR